MELQKLLETHFRRKSVGTLTLNKHQRFREVFFEGESIYLVGELYSGKVYLEGLTAAGVSPERLPTDKLQELLANLDLTEHLIPTILHEQGLLSEEELAEAVRLQFLEEIADLLHRNTCSFHFQEGRVPENLLDCDSIVSRSPVAAQDVFDEIERRKSSLEETGLLLPDYGEIFVVTESGMSHRQTTTDDMALQHVFSLIDGFRDVQRSVRDSYLFEFRLICQIVDLMKRGFLKKTIHPELRGVSTNRLTPQEAEHHLPHFRNAVKYGVSEIAARERLAVVYEKLQKVDDAVIQYNFIGDALYRMKKPAKATKAYQRALTLKPGDNLLTDKIIGIYTRAAEEEIEKGNADTGIRFLQASLRLRPDVKATLDRLIQVLIAEKKLKELGDLLDVLRAQVTSAADPEETVGVFELVVESLPDQTSFRKRLINIYFDLDRKEAAKRHMEVLAEAYAANGNERKADELREKADRLQSGTTARTRAPRASTEASPKRRIPLKSPVSLTRIVAGLVLAFLVYQGYGMVVWHEIKSRNLQAYALGPKPVASESVTAGDNHDFAEECRDFAARFPWNVFLAEANGLRVQAEERARDLESRKHRRQLEAKLADARRILTREGDRELALKQIDELVDTVSDEVLVEKVQQLKAEIENYKEPTAEDLLESALSFENTEEWARAYAEYRKLTALYPEAGAAQNLMLPILLETHPSGAEVSLVDAPVAKTIGKTPLVVRVPPGGRELYGLHLDGYEAETAEILEPTAEEGPAEHPTWILKRKPSWSDSLPGSFVVPPTIEKGWILGATDRAPLLAIHTAQGQTGQWKTPPGLAQLRSPPIRAQEGFYTAWRDKKVRLFKVRTQESGEVDLELSGELSLDSPATTNLCVLAERDWIVIGTLNKQLKFLPRTADARTQRSLHLEGVPSALCKVSPGELGQPGEDLFVGSEEGQVSRYATSGGPAWSAYETVWSKPLTSNPVLELLPFGSRLLVLTKDPAEVISVDPTDGSSRRIAFAARPLQVVTLPKAKTIVAFLKDGTISRLGPEDESPTTVRRQDVSWPAGWRALRLVSLGEQLAVICGTSRRRTSEGMLVLDVSTPRGRLLQAIQSALPFQSLDSDGHQLLTTTRAGEDATELRLYSLGQR